MMAAYHLDFGTSSSSVGSGYVSVPVTRYSLATGYGWTDPSSVREVLRSSGTSLTSDLHAGKDRTFRLDLPNGDYLVTPTMGDNAMLRDHMDIYLNGKQVASNITVEAGRPYRPTYRVEVTDGKLAMRLVDRGGVTVRWAISALDVVSTTSQAPSVAISPDQVGSEGSELTFKGSAIDPTGLSYVWDFGDGKTATGTLVTKHRYADDGAYLVTLTATDSQGRVGRAVSTVIVKNVAPRIGLKGAPVGEISEGSSITLSSSVSDPSAADVTAGFQASWSVTKNGSPFASSTGGSTKFTFKPDDEGTYVARLTVADKDGAKSLTSAVTITAVDSPLRVNILGPYQGAAGKSVSFAALARDNGMLDSNAGFTYAWNFGDGGTASGATTSHKYAAPGTYTVTLKVTGRNGDSLISKTTAKISAATSASSLNDLQLLSANLLANTVYGDLTWDEMVSSGAWGVNAKWEQGTSSKWYIEQQRYGECLIIDGLLHNDPAKIAAGLKAFDWGFKQQAADGSFTGTQDPFHSTSFFVQAVARSCLLLKQSPYADQYQAKIDIYKNRIYKAALWMARPEVWSRGISNNSPYTHRRYLVATAMGLTSRLVGGNTLLSSLARSQIKEGVSWQWTNGVNPEAGGYDSSYQAVGLTYAQLWATYFPNDVTTSAVKTMLSKGLAWEQSRVLSSGLISTDGNTRTGVETGPSGTIKNVNWQYAVTTFSCSAQSTGDTRWQAIAQKVAQYYFKNY
ncbi:MAG: PKD domain-containing protein [Planctomycetes bacterium]|nr:PKD domain-containing protein [Planctomycetota bacterium]